MREGTAKGDDLHVTRADIDRIQYACIAARMGDGPQALLVLGPNDGIDLNWISAKREVLVTRNGRVVKTYGLEQDVKATVFLTPDPVGGPSGDFAASKEFVRTLDLEPRHQDGVVVRSTFEPAGVDEIDILGARLRTELWQERGAAPEIDWTFVNQYWIDPGSGYVWKSRQVAAPLLPPIEIIIYRRPA
ncbi:MAG TPA: YjbF family lipoprotein [Stellaceae bacterium]|nr:YjbF family lipoprotein [Stellaceae bacterium]